MTTARAEFLGAGHYAPLADVLAELSQKYASAASLIIEPGAGTGYYISRVLDRLSDKLGLAIDISKYAARRCARAHARLGAVVADVWDQLPLKDESASVILSAFAPRQPRELFRTLQRKGILIIAAPYPAGHVPIAGTTLPIFDPGLSQAADCDSMGKSTREASRIFHGICSLRCGFSSNC